MIRGKQLCASAVLAGLIAAGCASGPQYGYQPQDGYPPPGGYEEQMREEEARRTREAAGELLPQLQELQRLMIEHENRGR